MFRGRNLVIFSISSILSNIFDICTFSRGRDFGLWFTSPRPKPWRTSLAACPWPWLWKVTCHQHYYCCLPHYDSPDFCSTLWLFNIAVENPLQMEVLMGTSSITGPFSMLNNQRVLVIILSEQIEYFFVLKTITSVTTIALILTSITMVIARHKSSRRQVSKACADASNPWGAESPSPWSPSHQWKMMGKLMVYPI